MFEFYSKGSRKPFIEFKQESRTLHFTCLDGHSGFCKKKQKRVVVDRRLGKGRKLGDNTGLHTLLAMEHRANKLLYERRL